MKYLATSTLLSIPPNLLETNTEWLRMAEQVDILPLCTPIIRYPRIPSSDRWILTFGEKQKLLIIAWKWSLCQPTWEYINFLSEVASLDSGNCHWTNASEGERGGGRSTASQLLMQLIGLLHKIAIR